ncbi:MAG: hypothetical protein ABIO16_13870 [Nocardioides sp.]
MRRMPLSVLVVSVVLGLGTGATAVVVGSRHHQPSTSMTTPSAGAESEAVRLLRAWDARRARAYARGDVEALRLLYVAGSRTGRADVAVLRGYVGRDLTVSGMHTQVLGADVVGRTARRLTVEVTDVLVSAVASSGERRWALPRDRPSTRRVLLVRVRGEWRVSEAYAVD